MPQSKNLYSYGSGDSIDHSDPTGRLWHVVEEQESLYVLASRYLGSAYQWPTIVAWNPVKLFTGRDHPGQCLWIPVRSRRGVGNCDIYTHYDPVLRYMTRQMQINPHVMPWHWDWNLFDPWAAAENTALLIDFRNRETAGGSWDQKTVLNRNFGTGFDNFYTPIRGDRTLEAVFYDIWANIHYGYVGRSYGIPSDILFQAQRVAGGKNGPGDDLSVRIGIDLWGWYGLDITAARLQAAILQNLRHYRTAVDAKGFKWVVRRYPL